MSGTIVSLGVAAWTAVALVTGTSGGAVIVEERVDAGRISQENLEKAIPLGDAPAHVKKLLGDGYKETKEADGVVLWTWLPAGGDKIVYVRFRAQKVISRESRWHGIHWEMNE